MNPQSSFTNIADAVGRGNRLAAGVGHVKRRAQLLHELVEASLGKALVQLLIEHVLRRPQLLVPLFSPASHAHAVPPQALAIRLPARIQYHSRHSRFSTGC